MNIVIDNMNISYNDIGEGIPVLLCTAGARPKRYMAEL